MKGSLTVASTDLRDYAKSLGWNQLAEAVKDRLYVLENPLFERHQLIFPIDTTAPDYEEAVKLTIEKLAAFYDTSFSTLLRSLYEVNDDTIRFRISSEYNDERALPLAFAGSIISGEQQLLLAAASTVLKPQAHHPRLNRTEAQQLIETAQFRHTEPGSFIFKVSCPVNALEIDAPLFPDDLGAPFVRRTTLTVKRALRLLVEAIEADTLPQFIEQTKKEATPLVSSNLCEAVTRFYDEDLKNSLEVDVRWAATLAIPPQEANRGPIRIQRDYFSRIEEVRRALRDVDKPHEDTFIGTVERLDGDMTSEGKRAGEAILSLLVESETVRVRVNLNSDQYSDADKAHMTEGAYIRVSGKLNPGRQPRTLTEIRIFEYLPPS